MNHRKIEIINKLGLHARAAAEFVKVASGLNAEINIKFVSINKVSRCLEIVK